MDQGANNLRQGIEDTRAALDDKLSTLESKAQDTIDRARETLDLRSQVAERPWLALGAAVAAGYVLGSMGGNDQPQQGRYQFTETERFRQGQPRAFEVQSPDELRRRQQDTAAPPQSIEERGYEEARRFTPAMLQHERQPTASGGGLMAEFEDEISMLKTAALNTIRDLLRETVRAYVPALGDQLDRVANEPGRQRSPGVTAAPRTGPAQERAVGSSPSPASNNLEPDYSDTARKPYSSL